MLIVVSQVFVPDPASVGQHMADVAVEMARRGHSVRVYTSGRGYDDATAHYPRRENLKGVDVRRLPLGSFGKGSILRRVLGTASFMSQALLRMLFARNLEGIFFSTSPPLIGWIATLVGRLRGVPVAYWAMDLNPDQLIALGKLQSGSLTARMLEGINRRILRRSVLVVALDRFMAERLKGRFTEAPAMLESKMQVMPPWPHESHVEPAAHIDNPFRARHGLAGKRVIMYSGNHSPSNPLGTLLEAALRFKDDPDLRFLFIGGGSGKKAVEEFIHDHGMTNAISLPYQPLSDLRYSLAAADVHVVSLGQEMVGIIHPCKIYGAMAAGRPILYVGPRPSHVSDLLDAYEFGWQFAHGDVEAGVAALEAIRACPLEQLEHWGQIARETLLRHASQRLLCSKLCDAIESGLGMAATVTSDENESDTSLLSRQKIR
jgi:glycosyltransferase involved in cell wall biosynthesis